MRKNRWLIHNFLYERETFFSIKMVNWWNGRAHHWREASPVNFTIVTCSYPVTTFTPTLTFATKTLKKRVVKSLLPSVLETINHPFSTWLLTPTPHLQTLCVPETSELFFPEIPVKDGVDIAQEAPTQCEVQMFGERGYGEKVILEQKEVYYKTQSEACRLPLPESIIPPTLKARGLYYVLLISISMANTGI